MNKIKIGYILLFILGYSMLGLVSCSIIEEIRNDSLYEKIGVVTQLPSTDCRGILVDNEGFIYCCIQGYNQVYIFDNNGKLIKNFGIDALGGVFKIKFSEDNNLQVVTARNDKLYTFDKAGKLLKTENINDKYYDAFGGNNEKQYIDKNNISYQIKNNFFAPPQIIKVIISNHKEKLISKDIISSIEPDIAEVWIILLIGIIFLHFKFKSLLIKTDMDEL